MHLRIISLLFLFITAIAASGASNETIRHYGFRHLGSDEGISASYVKAIAQDSNGFIWFGTKNGLDRFDGVSVHSFSCHDSKATRGNNNIGSIYEAPDRKLWIGTDRGVYIFDPESEEFTQLDTTSANGVSVQDWIQTIQGDSAGNIWILAPNQGVFRYRDGKIEYYSVTNHNGDKEKLPESLMVSSQGNVIVGTNNRGVYFYDSQTNDFRKMGVGNPQFAELDNIIGQYIEELPDGRIVICSRSGRIFCIDPKTKSVDTLKYPRTDDIFVYSMKRVDNEIWLGTTDGIIAIDITTGTTFDISRNTMGRRSLSDNIITAMLVDRDNNVWAGTMFEGSIYIQRSGLIFEKYSADFTERGLSSNHIRGIAADSRGKIWIGTEEAGLNILDPATGKVKRLNNDNADYKITLCVETFGDDIYVGFGRGGCLILDSDGNRKGTLGSDLLKTVSDVYSVYFDSAGNLWVGASWGLYRKDAGADKFNQVDEVGYGWIHDILQDSKGTVWFASMGEGIWSYNPVTNTYRHYPYDEEHSNGLNSNSISSIAEDSKGRLWFSTDRGGLALYEPASESFRTFDMSCGLPDDTVYDIIEDNLGYLWFGTNRGLVKFNPETGEIKQFSRGNNQFNYKSAFKGADGLYYMGGVDGLLVFNPEQDSAPSAGIPLYFTSFRLAGAKDDSKSMATTKKSILYCDKLELENDCSDFSISIGSPVYEAHGNTLFEYRLLPTSTEWSTVSDPSNLTFAGLSPGDYTLEVKRHDNENTRRLAITVLSPWYSTWWADILYCLLFIGMLFGGWAIYRKRQMLKLAEKEEIFTIEKEKELYKKKMQFFTEIAHEIRTPLTLIGTPLEAIEEIGVNDSRIQRYLRVIRQNTSRLLDLTGQILDFQKMDSESHSLKFETVDINTLVQGIVDRFEVTIAKRNKELTCSLPKQQILANVDKEAVTKILSNLFNNAMKYSDKQINISLDTTETTFSVSVCSDGEKISGENRFRIFEPFYQATHKTDNGGVGIGLPLCRTLAHLHGGTIELLDDTESNSNTFVLSLPLKAEIDEPEINSSPAMTEYVLEEDSPVTSNTTSYSLLFVDDNDEMREFLSDQLSKDFAVETACNGVEALEKIKEHNFDIIVTDIMMPEMDGYELCKSIKNDSNISPIPVVFLTAKNDLESKVRALECGGESYIEKPFSIKYFRQQIKSLLDNRRHERKAFLNKPFFTVDNMKMNKADEEFMNKVVAIINDNISNENFNVESMADIFCMSRSSLLRKIKTLFNLSPVELIRIVRLKKAAELIQEGKYRMGDIGYMVGINSQSYFTRLFFKQFGITPKAFEKQCQEKMKREKNTEELKPKL